MQRSPTWITKSGSAASMYRSAADQFRPVSATRGERWLSETTTTRVPLTRGQITADRDCDAALSARVRSERARVVEDVVPEEPRHPTGVHEDHRLAGRDL